MNFTKVNGEVNAAEQTSGAGYVLGLTEYAKRVSVVEEATSTSCGWCARGTVGLEKVKSILGDAVIPLSIHTNYNYLDPMNADAYYSVYNTAFVNGYPSAMIDRVVSADPYIGLETKTGYDANGNACYKFGLDDAVKLVDQAILSEGTVSLEATQNDDKTIDVTTTASFLVDRETAPYSFVFVLSEDGMTGEDGYGTYEGKTYQMLWSQLNFYSTSYSSTSGYFTDTDMQKYVQGDYLYEGEVYNNVVVAAWGDSQYSPVYGFNDAFADGEILAGQTYTYSTKLDISGIETIQNYDKLKLAVLLVNENNLQIVNAAQVVLGNYAAGINGVNANDTVATEAARYNVAGVRTNDARGLNIVKYTDGSAKKLMVK